MRVSSFSALAPDSSATTIARAFPAASSTFLYPYGDEPPKPPQTVPALELPIKVGLAFVPSRTGAGALTEAERIGLLNKVTRTFLRP